MPLKERWKDSGSEIAAAAKTFPMDPSHVGKRALWSAQITTEGCAAPGSSGNTTLLGEALMAQPLILVSHPRGENVPECGTQKSPCQAGTPVSVSSNDWSKMPIKKI